MVTWGDRPQRRRVAGGNPPMRPDQEIATGLTRAGSGPAPSPAVITARRVIIFGPNGSLFVYSAAPGAGNLIASIAAQAGTDPYGNAFVSGETSYLPQGVISTAISNQGAEIIFYTGPPNGAGPWTQQSTITGGTAGGITVSTGELDLAVTQMLVQRTPGPANSAAEAEIQDSTGTGALALFPPAAPAVAALAIFAAAAADRAISIRVTGDTNSRLKWDSNGRADYSLGGVSAIDASFLHPSANLLQILTADLDIATAGRGLQIAEGANARMGTGTMAAGTVTIANTSVTANTRVFITMRTHGANSGFVSVAVTAGVSFTVSSSNAADANSFNWLLIEPG